VILCPPGELVGFDWVAAVLSDPTTQFGDPARGTSDVATQIRRRVHDQFFYRGQVAIDQGASVIRPEKVFGADVGRSLGQYHRQDMRVYRRLYQQGTREDRIDSETKQVVFVFLQGL
jgi:hypothetical protein